VPPASWNRRPRAVVYHVFSLENKRCAMTTTAGRPPFRIASFSAAILLSVLVAGCTAAGGTTPPGASSSPGESGPAGPVPPPSGFYLRAWQSQALAPQYTFGTLPAATIADGRFYDGMVAIPMIYPGPLYVGLSSQTISLTGIEAIIAEAQFDGLLGSKTDFTEQPMPGSVTCHLELTVSGVTRDLIGRCAADAVQASGPPGTPAAFNSFWNKITSLSAWLGPELGLSTEYSPSRLAVLAGPPTEAQAGMAAVDKPWPLASPFDSFGIAMGSPDYRCAVVAGADLAALLPAVKAGNQLTRFVDGQAVKKSLQVRVVLPGEPGPC
jgi:hypothetical protein